MKERIQCAAVRIRKGEGKFILIGGYRHSDIMLNLVLLGIRERVSSEDQGFMTSTGRFVDRKEAALIAESAGQLKRRLVLSYILKTYIKNYKLGGNYEYR